MSPQPAEGGGGDAGRPGTVLPDSAGDVAVALTPRQLAFLALLAALILAMLRRVFGGRGRRA